MKLVVKVKKGLQIPPIVMAWKFMQYWSHNTTNHNAVYGIFSSIPAYRPNEEIRGQFYNITNQQLSFTFNLHPVYIDKDGEVQKSDEFNFNTTMPFYQELYIKLDHVNAAMEFRAYDAPHPTQCIAYITDSTGTKWNTKEQLKVNFVYNGLYSQQQNDDDDDSSLIEYGIISKHRYCIY
eukprot:UN02100